ncbi:MAG: prepilin peptidase [Endomicrobiales bacterium]|nr:prepilin peptidase [Endomicrobiales bacterium]
MMLDLILIIFISVSVYTDLRYRKVFNFITMPALILGVGFNLMYSGNNGLRESFYGILAGFGFLFLFYLMGGIGAGDVKFMAVIGAIKGYKFVLMGGIYGAVAAGIAAVLIMISKGRLRETSKKVLLALFCFASSRAKESIRFDEKDSVYMPYTVFLSIGMIIRWVELNVF